MGNNPVAQESLTLCPVYDVGGSGIGHERDSAPFLWERPGHQGKNKETKQRRRQKRSRDATSTL